MNKNCTDISQSERLRELGLDQATADFCYIGDEGPFLRSSDAPLQEGMTPAWSAVALLELMPKGTVFLSRYRSVSADFRGTRASYDISLSVGTKDTYMDAIYGLVEKALAEGHITGEEEEWT